MEYAKNMILYGPPGTGKTYNSVIYAVAICEGIDVKEIQKESYSDVLDRYNALKSSGRIEFTTFHQSYGYEEFIEGIKPVMNDDGNLSYTIEDGAFKTFCKRASAVEVHSDALTQLKKIHTFGELFLVAQKKRTFRMSATKTAISRLDSIRSLTKTSPGTFPEMIRDHGMPSIWCTISSIPWR
ncbi:MAG: hypothetical protein MR638_10035 [Lachnospiraceae bacterium]|nr:hypothetical protein [Lachnospiraceae bacterium]